MATEEASLDFNWRFPTDPSKSTKPWPLENHLGIKCYRNVVLIWLFHTTLLLNWIDDNHEKHEGNFCPLCILRELAERFWAKDRDDDRTFDRDVDKFWRETHVPGLIADLDRQNDAEEYLISLLNYLLGSGDSRWAKLIQVQKQCVKKCKECSFHTQDLEEDLEEGFILRGTISRKDIEYLPLCHTLRFSKSEKATCYNEGCPSKMREPIPGEDLRPVHDFFYGIRAAPPILVIHCKPYTTPRISENRYEVDLSGKVTRLEHSLALSSYPDDSLKPKTINWVFYQLYGVVLRRGDTGSTGHYVCALAQRQTGRWIFFNDHDLEVSKNGEPQVVTAPWTQSRLDKEVDRMQKGEWRIFMLMYRKLFEVPVRLLTRITSSSSAIALQDQQSLQESEGPESEEHKEAGTEDSGEPETEGVHEKFFTPEGWVGDEDLLDSESESDPGQTTGERQGEVDDEQLQGTSDWETRNVQAEQSMPIELLPEHIMEVLGDLESSIFAPASEQARGETQGPADDERLQGDPSDSETRISQAEQLMPIELPTVENDPESFTTKSATEQFKEAAENLSQRDAGDSELQTGQADQSLPTDLPTEHGVEVGADLESSAATPDTRETEGRAQAEKIAENETSVKDENEQTTSSPPTYEITRTEVEPSVQPKKKQAKGKATKRAHDEALDEDEETSVSVPATKRARTGAKSSTKPKKKETKSKAPKRTRKDASDDLEAEKAEKPAPSTKNAKPVVEPTEYSGRETRSRAKAKRKNEEIPDVDKAEKEQTATSQPASKRAKTTKPPVQPGKAQTKSKAGRKK